MGSGVYPSIRRVPPHGFVHRQVTTSAITGLYRCDESPRAPRCKFPAVGGDTECVTFRVYSTSRVREQRNRRGAPGIFRHFPRLYPVSVSRSPHGDQVDQFAFIFAIHPRPLFPPRSSSSGVSRYREPVPDPTTACSALLRDPARSAREWPRRSRPVPPAGRRNHDCRNAAESVYATDLDGDDVDVSASYSDDKIAWYENLGGGSFGQQQVITTSRITPSPCTPRTWTETATPTSSRLPTPTTRSRGTRTSAAAPSARRR